MVELRFHGNPAPNCETLFFRELSIEGNITLRVRCPSQDVQLYIQANPVTTTPDMVFISTPTKHYCAGPRNSNTVLLGYCDKGHCEHLLIVTVFCQS